MRPRRRTMAASPPIGWSATQASRRSRARFRTRCWSCHPGGRGAGGGSAVLRRRRARVARARPRLADAVDSTTIRRDRGDRARGAPHDAAEEAFEAELDDHAAAAASDDDVPPFASPASTLRRDAGRRAALRADAIDDDAPTISDTAGDETRHLRKCRAGGARVIRPARARAQIRHAPPAQVMPAPIDEPRSGKAWPKRSACRSCSGSTSSPIPGLREQLALRLQPIVDRASADLVATINQHVGDLLRAYVAEAIEREIESWRRSH